MALGEDEKEPEEEMGEDVAQMLGIRDGRFLRYLGRGVLLGRL